MDYSEYNDECNRILQIVKKYESCYEECFNSKLKEVVREEFCTGGELLHRGYYCPSLIRDIVIGNVKRGRLVKKEPENKDDYFRYGFDKAGNLITVIRPYTCEFIVREGNIEIGVGFNKQNGIGEISEAYYEDNRIVSYGHYLYDEGMDISEYEKELYTYKDSSLSVDYINYLCGYLSFLTHSEYNFTLREGFLDTYTVKQYKADNGETMRLLGFGEAFLQSQTESKEKMNIKLEEQDKEVYRVRIRRRVK